MASDYVTPIISASIGAIAAIIVNYYNYKHTIQKENESKFLKEQITDLLLPLLIQVNIFENEMNAGNRKFEEILFGDKEIQKIVTNKLYLASPKLSRLLLQFINDQYLIRRNLPLGNLKTHIFRNYDELKNTIYEEFDDKRQQHQKIYLSNIKK